MSLNSWQQDAQLLKVPTIVCQHITGFQALGEEAHLSVPLSSVGQILLSQNYVKEARLLCPNLSQLGQLTQNTKLQMQLSQRLLE